MTHVFRWNRMGRKGQRCRVLALGKMNSCLVEFEDGEKMITSRFAVKLTKEELARRAKERRTHG